MTTPISPSSTGAAAAPAAVTPRDQMGKDTFLALLVAQLKYQDPMNPADGADLMAQTAQFSVVEKLDELARQNSELLSSHRSLGASALLGRSVAHAGPAGADVVSTVTGVRFAPTGPVLLTSGGEVALAAVKEVRPAGS